MANDFTIDSNCVALWRMESGALTTDSIGTNTLTNNGVGEVLIADWPAFVKEGSCAANFESTQNDYLSITDANLDAGFPLKSGDTSKLFSCTFWIKSESFAARNYIISKYNSGINDRSFAITTDHGVLSIINAYTGTSYDIWDSASMSINKWYHIGIAHDGVNKSTTIRVYDENSSFAKIYTHNWTYETNVNSIDFMLGERADLDGSYDYDGILDEVVIFKDLLSEQEMEYIQNGVYGSTTGKKKVSNLNLEIEYVPDSKQIVTGFGIEVEYVVSSGSTGTITAGIDALFQKSLDLTAGVDALMQSSDYVSTNFDTLLQTSQTVNINLDADLVLVETVGVDAHIQGIAESTSSIDSNLQGFNFLHIGLDALTQRPPEEIPANISGLLKAEGIKATTTIDAHLQEAGLTAGGSVDANLASNKAATSSIDANLAESALTIINSIDAVLQKNLDSTTRIHAFVLDPFSKIEGLGAYLQKTDLIKTANLDSYLQIIKTSTAALDGNLVKSTFDTVSLDAYLKRLDNTVVNSMDALLLPTPSDSNNGMFLIF